MALKTRKVEIDIPRPAIEGWYWYYATDEELKELSIEKVSICKLRRTAEKVLVAEFLMEIRRVSKLMGKWSKKLEPTQ